LALAVGSLEREPQNTSLDHLIWLCTVFVALRACYAALVQNQATFFGMIKCALRSQP
jgi:hypothetical protein